MLIYYFYVYIIYLLIYSLNLYIIYILIYIFEQESQLFYAFNKIRIIFFFSIINLYIFLMLEYERSFDSV